MKIYIDKSNWKRVKLGDVSFEYSKRINNPSESDFDRFVGSSNIGQWDFRVHSWESIDSVTSAMKLFEPDDYLLVRRSLYASDFRERAPRANFYGVCSGDILTIKENPEFISDGFLIGILNSPELWKYVVANASGSITRRIKWKDLANYEFLLPSKDQQKQLAELLWAMDDVIEKEWAVKERLKIQLLSLEEEYFRGKNEAKLKDVVEKTLSGGTPDTKNTEFYTKGSIPWITTKILDNDFINIGEKFISTTAIKKSAAKILPKGNLVAGTRVGVGKFAVNQIDISFSQDINGLIINKQKVIPEFLVYQLNSSVFQNRIQPLLRGTTIKGVIKEDLLNLPIHLPEINFQEQIGILFNNIKKNKKLIESKITNSKALQKSLLNQIF